VSKESQKQCSTSRIAGKFPVHCTYPCSATGLDVDRGVLDSSRTSQQHDSSPSELKHHITFWFKGSRNSTFTRNDTVLDLLLFPPSSLSDTVRAQSLRYLSIMKSFDPHELRKPLLVELLNELEWEAQMDEETRNKYRRIE